MPFIQCARAANAASPDGNTRSIASRLWQDHCVPSAALVSAARAASEALGGPVGRVHSLGSFESAGFAHELKTALPDPLATALRPGFEWYACRGAFFHNDAHYEGVLFGVWSVLGPERELVFPRIDRKLPAQPGSIVVFDPFEPHAVLNHGVGQYRGEDYEGQDANVFLGFEVALTPAVVELFGIGVPHDAGPVLSSRVAINPETGAFAAGGFATSTS